MKTTCSRFRSCLYQNVVIRQVMYIVYWTRIKGLLGRVIDLDLCRIACEIMIFACNFVINLWYFTVYVVSSILYPCPKLFPVSMFETHVACLCPCLVSVSVFLLCPTPVSFFWIFSYPVSVHVRVMSHVRIWHLCHVSVSVLHRHVCVRVPSAVHVPK